MRSIVVEWRNGGRDMRDALVRSLEGGDGEGPESCRVQRERGVRRRRCEPTSHCIQPPNAR